MPSPKFHYVDMLLSCSKGTHEDCAALKDAVFKNFRQVTTAHITKTYPATDYCVSASAIVKHKDIGAFRRRLNAMRNTCKTAGPVASKIKLFVSV